MFINEFASKMTLVTFTSSGEIVKVDSGRPIKIYGIISSNAGTGNTTVEMRTGDEATVLKLWRHTLRTQKCFSTPFLAEEGISFKFQFGATPSNQYILVFHSQLGA